MFQALFREISILSTNGNIRE